MRFDINEYKGKFVMHCKTIKEAKDFCNYLHSIGRKWSTGMCYCDEYHYFDYTKNTVYHFNDNGYGSLKYAQDNNYTILEWEDFMNKEFTKADLKDGMVVEYRDGRRAMFLDNKLMASSHYTVLSNFTNTLEHVSMDSVTIVKVYQSKASILESYFNNQYLTLIWERESVKEMTVAEIEKELGYKVKIVGEK